MMWLDYDSSRLACHGKDLQEEFLNIEFTYEEEIFSVGVSKHIKLNHQCFSVDSPKGFR